VDLCITNISIRLHTAMRGLVAPGTNVHVVSQPPWVAITFIICVMLVAYEYNFRSPYSLHPMSNAKNM